DSAPSREVQADRKLLCSNLQVLRDVVEDLRAQMRGRAAPPLQRRARRLDSVAEVLAVSLTNLADLPPAGVIDRQAIPRVRPRLLPTDIELGGTVHGQESRVESRESRVCV